MHRSTLWGGRRRTQGIALLAVGIALLLPASPAAGQANERVWILPHDLHADWSARLKNHLEQEGWTNVFVRGPTYSGLRSKLYCRAPGQDACNQMTEIIAAITGNDLEAAIIPPRWGGDVVVGIGDDARMFFDRVTPEPEAPEKAAADPIESMPARKKPSESAARFEKRMAFSLSFGAGHLNPVFGGAFEFEIAPVTFFVGGGKWVSPTRDEKGIPHPQIVGYGTSVGAGYYYDPPRPRWLQILAFGLYGTARKIITPLDVTVLNGPSMLLGLRFWPMDKIPVFFRASAGVQKLPKLYYPEQYGLALDLALGISTRNRYRAASGGMTEPEVDLAD